MKKLIIGWMMMLIFLNGCEGCKCGYQPQQIRFSDIKEMPETKELIESTKDMGEQAKENWKEFNE